jgi:protein-disulfide isomerase
MRRLICAGLGVFFGCVALLANIPPAVASAHGLSAEQANDVRQIVRELLRDNPEIILDAIEALQARDQASAEERARSVIRARRDELLNDPDSPVAGNPAGDITLVEFFDYQCPYCKRVHPTIQALLRDDPSLRFVYKEWPILGAASVYAARAALAARAQGKYQELHAALMETRGTLSESSVLAAARAAGLDVDRLKRDMDAQVKTAEASFARTMALARALDIRGTPAFVVGDTVIRGAVDAGSLKKIVAEARRRAAQ